MHIDPAVNLHVCVDQAGKSSWGKEANVQSTSYNLVNTQHSQTTSTCAKLDSRDNEVDRIRFKRIDCQGSATIKRPKAKAESDVHILYYLIMLSCRFFSTSRFFVVPSTLNLYCHSKQPHLRPKATHSAVIQSITHYNCLPQPQQCTECANGDS